MVWTRWERCWVLSERRGDGADSHALENSRVIMVANMSWSLEDIERGWIGGEVSALAVPPAFVVAAFDLAERYLGRTWIEKARIGSGNINWGPVPSLRIVNMGQKLAVLKNVKDPKRLLVLLCYKLNTCC